MSGAGIGEGFLTQHNGEQGGWLASRSFGLSEQNGDRGEQCTARTVSSADTGCGTLRGLLVRMRYQNGKVFSDCGVACQGKDN